MEAQIGMVFYVNSASIVSRGAFRFMWAGINAPAPEGASVFMGILDRIISPWTHFMAGFAKWMAFLVEGDVIRGIVGRFCPAVDVNQRIHAPMFQQFISWDVVMCRVQADILWGRAGNIASEIINCIEEIFAVVATRAGEFHQQGEFDFQGIVPAAQHVKRMPEIPCFFVTVPSPFSVRVGVAAGTAAAVWAGVAAGRKMPAERGGMGNYGGAVAGHGKLSCINQTEPYGWEECKDGKDPL